MPRAYQAKEWAILSAMSPGSLPVRQQRQYCFAGYSVFQVALSLIYQLSLNLLSKNRLIN
jgi:hypothetical protein